MSEPKWLSAEDIAVCRVGAKAFPYGGLSAGWTLKLCNHIAALESEIKRLTDRQRPLPCEEVEQAIRTAARRCLSQSHPTELKTENIIRQHVQDVMLRSLPEDPMELVKYALWRDGYLSWCNECKGSLARPRER